MLSALIAPRKYVQGRGALAQAGELIRPLGTRALVVFDRMVWEVAAQQVVASLHEAELTVETLEFRGECSDREIARVVGIGREFGAEVLVAVGGGKVIDTVKAAGHQLAGNWVVIPTIASTDAPTSALSVIYTDDGVVVRYDLFPKNPDLVLVDTEVIANAPARFLSAGIGDGLSTWVEARANHESRKPALSGGVATTAAAAIAKLCWDTLFAYGVAALHAVERHAVTLAVEKVVEANTLLSGLGFESNGVAAAHAIHNGLTVLEPTHALWHGEKVAFGTLAQLVLEGRPTSELHEFIDFCTAVKLPTTLAELQLADVSRADLQRVAERACDPTETIHNMPFPVTPAMVLDAILAADAIATARKAELAPARERELTFA